MTAQPYRFTAPDPRDPILHELSPLLLCDQSITLHLTVRRAEDGTCRYVCRDQNLRLRYPKEKVCPLVREPEAPNAAAKAPVNSAALSK